MTQIDKLRVYFVLPSDDTKENEVSSDMALVSQMVSNYGGHTEWMKPSQCVEHTPEEKDVFVFDKFEGIAFETLKRNASKVVGSRCLLTCITNGRPIPPNPHPVFTEGMRDLWVTSTGFDQATKKQIQEKVQYMSGNYDNSLRSIITHLVAFNNISTKAIHSYKCNIKIMKLSWIEDVWQQSLVSNVNGKSPTFDKHLSPLFHNLNITTSGIPKKEKDSLKEMIENHGGRFMGTLEENVTNIVLLTKSEGEKYKYAKNWNIPCVKPLWVRDCISAKAILSFKEYGLDANKLKSSTPNKENCTVNFTANFTTNLSMINNLDTDKRVTHLDETVATLSGKSDFQTTRNLAGNDQFKNFNKTEKTIKSSHANVINNVLLKNFKDAGQFLDGIIIFLHGFNSEDAEKLKKILNAGGATRLNELSESVTHVIAGKNDESNLANLAKFGAYVLSIEWIVESMKLKSPATESKFLLVNRTSNPTEPPSPMSKQGAELLSQTEKTSLQKPQFSLQNRNDNEKFSQLDELLCRYNASQPGEPLNQPEMATPLAATTSSANKFDHSVTRSSNISSDEFFRGLSFFLSNDLSEEEIKYLEDLILERDGQIVGKRDLGVPDYAVVPVIGASLTEVTAKEVVNIYYVKDCCVEGCVLTPRYYHQPVACVKNATPLTDCVISVSNYVQGEREFMEMMIEVLGGVAQSLLARKPKQGALKSTHLVCAEPQGQKYNGAVRWGLPVVHHDWLLKCAALGIRVSEKPYLVGESKLLSNPESKASQVTLSSENKTKNSVEPVDASTASTSKLPSENKTKNSTQPVDVSSASTGRLPLGAKNKNSTEPIDTFAASTSRLPTDDNYKLAPPADISSRASSEIIAEIRRSKAIERVKATETPKTDSPDPNRTITPNSPYGAFYGKGSPTPGTRKRIWKWMNQGAELPLDPPSKPLQSDGDSTPLSQLISRHLEMLKRKPEDLPPDSPTELGLKRLNLDPVENLNETTNENKASVASSLSKMRKIEEGFTKNILKSPTVSKPSEPEPKQMVVVTESQAHTEVGWEDPVEKEVALETLEKAVKAKPKPKMFMFSCITEQLAEAKSLVEECGGEVSQLPYFDTKATHLIAGNLTRAEKLLGSIAAGLWVLHPSYLDALKTAKSVHSVNEEDYEWGSPKQKFRLNLLHSTAKEFANCSYIWRLSILNGESPPFKDMKIILHPTEAKYDSFKRLIEAGGGKVVTGQPPYNYEIDANLCVYDSNNTEPVNFPSLARQKIQCVSPIFISDALLRKNDAIEKNLVPEFIKHWKTKTEV